MRKVSDIASGAFARLIRSTAAAEVIPNAVKEDIHGVSVACEMKTKLLAVASKEFVDELEPMVIKLAFSNFSPGRDAYIRYMDNAYMMILSGCTEEHVKEMFQKKLDKEHGKRGRNSRD